MFKPLTVLLSIFALFPTGNPIALDEPQNDYAHAHQHSLMFFYGQMSGRLPKNHPFNWRTDCCLDDGKDVGLDLTEGYFDCGDHVMFGEPGSFALYMLALSGIHYKPEYIKVGEWERFLQILKRGTDFWIRAHPQPYVLYAQVGNGVLDHSWWGPPEFMRMPRPSYQINATHPGSEVAGSVAATLAFTSLIYKDIDPEYSKLLVRHARELFDFASQYQGFYHKSIPDATNFYTSSHYDDEILLGSLALFWATGESRYSAYAVENSRVLVQKTLTWAPVWDDASYANVFLLWKLIGDSEAEICLLRFFDHWLNRIPRTPGGLTWLTGWGSLRYPTATSFLMLMYIDSKPTIDTKLKTAMEKFALSQVNYILGNNPYQTSYLNGWGQKYFESQHSRGSHGSWNNSLFSPPKNRHRNYALIGGPDLQDKFSNDIVDFSSTECCMDMQVGFVGTTIALSKRYPGTPLKNFPPKEVPENEYFLSGSIAKQSKNSIQLNLQIEARTGWPARSEQLCFRYYLYLEQLNVEVHSYYNEQAELGIITKDPNNECSYYIPVCWKKGVIYPQSTTTSRKQVQLTIHLPYNNPSGSFDRTRDWSFSELSTEFRDNLLKIPIYENGVRMVGSEPQGVKCGSKPPSPPSPTPSPTPSPNPPQPSPNPQQPSPNPPQPVPTPQPSPQPTPNPSSTTCSAVWQQCGGKTWNGPTCCVAGTYCNTQNEWYSQCLPGNAPTPTPVPTPVPDPVPTPVPSPDPVPAPSQNPRKIRCKQCVIEKNI